MIDPREAAKRLLIEPRKYYTSLRENDIQAVARALLTVPSSAPAASSDHGPNSSNRQWGCICAKCEPSLQPKRESKTIRRICPTDTDIED